MIEVKPVQMPEGCECRIIAEQLNHLLSGKWLTKLEINEKSRYYVNRFSGQENLSFPYYVDSVTTRGKLIIFTLIKDDKVSWLLSNLGMEGRWVTSPEKHSGILLYYDVDNIVYYDDSRHFGILRYIVDETSMLRILSDLGPDILDLTLKGLFSLDGWLVTMRKYNRRKICDALLDQKVISGVGNYLRSDSLYLSRIRPDLFISEISDDQLKLLGKVVSDLMIESYRAGGFTLRSFHRVDGMKGEYIPKIYGKKEVDGLHVTVFKDKDKRSIFTVLM